MTRRDEQTRAVETGGLIEGQDPCRLHGRAGDPAAHIESLEGGVAGRADVEDVGLGFDDAHRKTIEGMHQYRGDGLAAIGGGHIPKLLVVKNGHQDRAVGAHGKVLQEEVLRKAGDWTDVGKCGGCHGGLLSGRDGLIGCDGM